MISRKAASMLSLAKRAGKLISGEDTVIMSIRDRACCLVIIAEDAAENTKNKILSRAGTADVDCIVKGMREELSSSAGLYNRTVFAVTDSGFAKAIKAELLL